MLRCIYEPQLACYRSSDTGLINTRQRGRFALCLISIFRDERVPQEHIIRHYESYLPAGASFRHSI